MSMDERQVNSSFKIVARCTREGWQNGRKIFHQLFTNTKAKHCLKKVMPAFLLVLLILLGGILLHEVEVAHGIPLSDPFLDNATSGCLAYGDYWSTFQYVNGLCTAVALGVHTPCSTGGRVLAVVYTIVGIPLALIVLAQVGSFLTIQCNRCYKALWLLYTRVYEWQYEPKSIPSNKLGDMTVDTPLWFVVGICIAWVLLCGMFYTVKNDWNFGIGSFFSFSLITIGSLKDITDMGIGLAIQSMISLFIGLALISNIVNTVLANIDRTVNRAEIAVTEESKQAIANDTPIADIADILKSLGAPAYVIEMIPKAHMEHLQSQIEKAGSLANSSTQTDAENERILQRVSTDDKCIEAVYETNDQECTACPSSMMVSTQIDSQTFTSRLPAIIDAQLSVEKSTGRKWSATKLGSSVNQTK